MHRAKEHALANGGRGGEEGPLAEEALIDGVSLADLVSSRPLEAEGPGGLALTEEQRAHLRRVEGRASKVAIPTQPDRVVEWLRLLGEPIIFFGEGPYEQRERLKALLTTTEGHHERLERIASLTGAQRRAPAVAEEVPPSGPVGDDQEFYTPGSDDLVAARKAIVRTSMESARRRLAHEQSLLASLTTAQIEAARRDAYKRLSSLALCGSQVGAVGDCSRPLSAASLALDGSRHVAIGDFEGNCSVWDAGGDCRLVARLAPGSHASRIGAVVFSPDGESPVVAASCDSDGVICMWQRPSATAPDGAIEYAGRFLRGHTARVPCIAFHPTGAYLASASFDYSWRLWDVERGRELQLQEGHSKQVYAVACHSDGGLVATGGMDAIGRLWDIRCGRSVWLLSGHAQGVLSIDFHKTKPLIATASEDGTVRIWDIRALRCAYTIPAHSSVATGARWFPSGDGLLTTGFDGQARVWGGHDWSLLRVLSGHEGKVLGGDCVEGLAVTASADRTFKVWRTSA